MNLYAYAGNRTFNEIDRKGLMYTLRKVTEITWVSKNRLGGLLGRFAFKGQEPNPAKINSCLCVVQYGNHDISGQIEQAKEDEAYLPYASYVISKDFISSHERNHAKDYYGKISKAIKETEKYEGYNWSSKAPYICDLVKLTWKFYYAYIRYNATKLDAKDYVGDSKKDAERNLVKRKETFIKAKKEYEKAKKKLI